MNIQLIFSEVVTQIVCSLMIKIVNELVVVVENVEKEKMQFVAEYHNHWRDEEKQYNQELMLYSLKQLVFGNN